MVRVTGKGDKMDRGSVYVDGRHACMKTHTTSQSLSLFPFGKSVEFA